FPVPCSLFPTSARSWWAEPDIPVGWAVLCQGIVIVKNQIEHCPPEPDIPVGWAVLCQGIVIVKNPIEQCPPED
ncbi:MAG: hypothetical protein F6K26_26540, partial [Moorea sp. SIO2I5]|nr:hypothetical protein [Moorena sp. SIO2I5]